MLISQKINDAINQQIGNEFMASLQYVAIAAYYECEALSQLANFFYGQATEEHDHAMRFVKFVLEAGGKVAIPAIPAPRTEFSSAVEVVKLTLDREIGVTDQINALVHLAKTEKNYITDNFLQWFVREQLEEVSSMDQLHKILERAGESGLLRVEEYLARKGGKLSPIAAVD